MFLPTRFIPATPSAFDRHLDRMFHDVFETSSPASPRTPAVDIWEDEKSYFVDVELPGFEDKDVNVTVQDDELRIDARREDGPRENAKPLYRERRAGEVTRVLRFPLELEHDSVEARFHRGVLHVTLPKAKVALPRRIEIKG